jgi:hypothetical protein
MQPFDYRQQVVNPFEQAIQGAARGFQLGTNIRAIQEQRQAALEKREAEMLAQQELQAAFADLDSTPNPTLQQVRNVVRRIPADQGRLFVDMYKTQSEQTQNTAKRLAAQLVSSLSSDLPGAAEIGRQMLLKTAESERNAGNEDQAKAYETYAQIIEKDPSLSKTMANQFLAYGTLTFGENWAKGIFDISKEAREAALHPDLVAQRNAERAKAESQAEIEEINAEYAERMAKANLNRLTREASAEGGDNVQSSKILDDGTAVIVTKSGRTRVIDTAGNELTGDARGQAIRDAEAFGAETQMRRAGGRKGAEIGQATALKAFESVGKVRQNIENLNQAISALNRGARTGAIESRFPNWKASSIELQNIQRQLGLDIIGSVTFGALSEGELNLALETALPVTMNERELRDWLQRKITAQTKLADYLSEQARFLSVPGRTINDWLERPPQGAGQPSGAAPAAAPAMRPGFRVIR